MLNDILNELVRLRTRFWDGCDEVSGTVETMRGQLCVHFVVGKVSADLDVGLT